MLLLIVIEMPNIHVRHLNARLYKKGQNRSSNFADGEVEKQEVK